MGILPMNLSRHCVMRIDPTSPNLPHQNTMILASASPNMLSSPPDSRMNLGTARNEDSYISVFAVPYPNPFAVSLLFTRVPLENIIRSGHPSASKQENL